MRSTSILGAVVSIVLLACGGGSSDASPEDLPPVADPADAAHDPSTEEPSPEIGITAPSTIVVRAGASSSFDVKLARPEGVTGPIALEIVDLPKDVTAKVALGEEDTATVTLEASTEASLGDHLLRLRASAGSVTGEARAPLVVAGAPGTLDTTYGSAGVAPKLPGVGGQSLTIDRQGRAIVTGLQVTEEIYQTVVSRFLPNGALDTTFGEGGTLRDVFVGALMSAGLTTTMLDDGGMIVSGAISAVNDERQTCFVKLDATGKRVTTFGKDGQVCAPANVSIVVRETVVGSDGSIYAAGTLRESDGDMSVLKVTKDGVLDSTFGAGGSVTLVLPGAQDVVGVALDSAGRLVVGGNCSDDYEACAWRLDASGTIDTTYGGGLAKGTTGMLGMEAMAMTLGPKDELFIVGGTVTSQMAVVAFDDEGEMLSSFGSGGWLTFALSAPELLFGAVWDDGKLLLAGRGRDPDTAEDQTLMVRVSADGQLDPTFAKYGYALYPTAGTGMSIVLTPGRATILTVDDGVQLIRIWR